MTSYERWSLLASFGSLLVSVVAFGALAWQLLLLSRNTGQDHERRRKQATMEYLTANMDRRKALFDEGIPDERDHEATAALINRSLSGDDQATKLITSYLTTFNFLAVGAQSDAFDREVIDEAWGGLIIAVWNGYRPWAEAQRKEHGEPRVWDNLEWLAGQMEPRRSVIPTGGSGNLPPRGNLPPQGQPVP
ncbi:DUF4760 domain-containing protein [Streptomyces spongiae]|uniref:DUF4760 domain-containing protein n=1 Tax=Streptomyces spongiae TaxID=565072 RepID=A0A5N8XV71_9ACTN|nr:DUF4760 domain-containing protein [Streptomyces spongiae]MPY63273.1 DUF4760 domain-containing protein [Streptomyces spongiae]